MKPKCSCLKKSAGFLAAVGAMIIFAPVFIPITLVYAACAQGGDIKYY